MTDSIHLSFTLGPVQAFVAQARRTRDLWAGSWLLSYLAESALAAAEQVGGEASETIIPHRAKGDRTKVTTVRTVVGGVPNRFEIRFEAEDQAKKAGDAAIEGFREAWQHIADKVWKRYVEPVAKQGRDTKEIWDHQVKNFWECAWVAASPDEGEKTIGRIAAARKAFRNVPAKPEPGVKCSLMGELQELSGFGPGEKQRQFWDALRSNARKTVGTYDLGDTERLCAVALIKRLFLHVISNALGERAEEAELEMLKAQTGWPSTAFFATRSWLQDELAGSEHETKAKAYANEFVKAVQNADHKGDGQSDQQAAQEADLPDWAGLDATAWFPGALQHNEWDIAPKTLKALLKQLRQLHDDVGQSPVPYYALLLMDGDSMGRLLETLEDPQELSRCLGDFAGKVAGIVRNHGGRTIYAGGDDVLAMLPAKGALEAADELTRAYTKSLDGKVAADLATLSGTIVFAHWKFPLRQVLEQTHRLLDDEAKERTGRNALAIGIVQGSGLNATWSAPWPVVRGKHNGAPALEKMLEHFGTDDTQDEADDTQGKTPEFNASYLYHLREQFGRLFDDFREEPGRFAKLSGKLAGAAKDEGPDGLGLLGDIAHAEYRRRMSKDQRKDKPPDHTRPLLGDLMALSHRWTRSLEREETTEKIESDPATFSFDGWRVARFLKQIQEGKVTGHE